MVKKLLKQEYKYYIRTFIFILPAILLLGLSVRVIQFFEVNHFLYYLAFGGLLVMFFGGSAAVIIAAEVLAVVRFYKNMYSTEGYLTFTLPVTNHQHLISKLIAHVICSLTAVLAVLLSWIIAFVGTQRFSLVMAEFSSLFAEINFGPHIGHIIFFVLECIILIVVSLFASPLTYYSCISIGQLAKKNRILLAIGVYYLYGVIVNVISTVFSMIVSIIGLAGGFDGLVPIIEAHPFAFAHTMIWILIIISAGLVTLFYFINIKIMNNKLNLE